MVALGGICMVAVLPYFVITIGQWLKSYPNWVIWLVRMGGLGIFVAGILSLTKQIYSTKKNYKTDDTSHPKGN
jgi:hypothetical protein